MKISREVMQDSQKINESRDKRRCHKFLGNLPRDSMSVILLRETYKKFSTRS